MAKTVVGNAYDFNELRSWLKLASVFMPLLVVALGFGVRNGLFDSSHYHSDAAFLLVASGFVAIAAWQLIHPLEKQSNLERWMLLATYHVLAIGFILLISGFTAPLVFCWLVLLVATDYFFGNRALAISMLLLIATWVISSLQNSDLTNQSIVEGLTAIVLIVVIGGMVSRLRLMNDNERRATERSHDKELLQHDRLLTLVNGIGEAVISTDKTGVVRLYNAAALNLLDTNQTLVGKHLEEVLQLRDQVDQPVTLKDLKHNLKGKLVRTDLTHTFDDGEKINLYLNLTPIRPSFHQRAPEGYILVMRDITNEKSLEEERDEFISVVSHELRTPITIAEGTLSNARVLFKQKGDSKKAEAAIDEAHEQVLYLAQMINDLSTLSRAERGLADDSEEIDVRELVNELYKKYLPEAETKKLHFNLEISPQSGKITASRLYLEEVLQNFITNAIKYTQEGSITLKTRHQAGKVEFSVSDSGIGISKSDQRRVFEKFYRSEDYRTRETSGTGLGLYVVHKLAKKLGTKIEMQSRLNHGSTFSFWLENSA